MSDVLSQTEIDTINRSSEIVRKYSQNIDRESAFEILSEKIEKIQKKADEEAARKEWEKGRKGDTGRKSTSGTSGRKRRTTVSPVVKVLTSATFIRGVLGIMKQVIK